MRRSRISTAFTKRSLVHIHRLASGKSSEEMLALLRDRLENEREDELRIAAAEQAKSLS